MTRRPTARAALALAAVLAAGCGSHAASDPAEKAADPVVPVRTAALASASFEDALEVPGAWKSAGELVVAAPFAAVVESVGVRVGDPVTHGQWLARLVTRESQAALRGAELMSREAADPAAREEAARALALARRELVRLPLRAAADGVVLRRTAEPGAQVAESGEVLAIAPWKTLVFEAHVPPASAARVHAGQTARIREADGSTRAARVGRALPTTDETDQASVVRLEPASPPRSLGIGRFATATLVLGAMHDAIAVPDSAVVEDDVTGEQRIALVDAAAHAHWQVVKLGAAGPGRHELLTPTLAAGTRVILEGQRGLVEGTRVRPAP